MDRANLGREADRRRFRVAGEAKPLAGTARAALAGELPPRYATDNWTLPFLEAVSARLEPGMRILDLGGGAAPSLGPEQRPADSLYVGLDISASELARAPAGAYDEIVEADARERQPDLEGRFDLVLSWFLLEHVSSVQRTLDNVRAYLRPGGHLVAQAAGARSVFGLLNRAVPERLARWSLVRLQGRFPESIFSAHYDNCTYSGLTESLCGWEQAAVTPLNTGVGYFRFSRLLAATYIAYEEWVHRGAHRELAAYYLVTARR